MSGLEKLIFSLAYNFQNCTWKSLHCILCIFNSTMPGHQGSSLSFIANCVFRPLYTPDTQLTPDRARPPHLSIMEPRTSVTLLLWAGLACWLLFCLHATKYFLPKTQRASLSTWFIQGIGKYIPVVSLSCARVVATWVLVICMRSC